MPEPLDLCVRPARGPIAPGVAAEGIQPAASVAAQGLLRMQARVSKEAPDFEVASYLDGGFTNVKLSGYRGQWVLLCFYPGDFTFV